MGGIMEIIENAVKEHYTYYYFSLIFTYID